MSSASTIQMLPGELTMTVDGYTGDLTSGMIELKYTGEFFEVDVDQLTTPAALFLIKEECSVTFRDVSFSNAILDAFVRPWVASGSGSKFGQRPGATEYLAAYGQAVTLHPTSKGADVSEDFHFYNCVAAPEFTKSFGKGDTSDLGNIVVKCYADPSRTDGDLIGNYNIAADAVAPTISGTVPADGAAAVAITDSFVATFSEELAASTVGTGSCFLIKATTTGIETHVVAAVTLVNSGASTTVTINPDASLSAATEYSAHFTDTVRDKAGNQFATAKYSFTTA